jgi:hypothetical protein
VKERSLLCGIKLCEGEEEKPVGKADEHEIWKLV